MDDVPVAREDRFAIVVGIDRYPGYTDLGGACNDATAFGHWLIDPDGGDVPVENVHLHLGRRDARDDPRPIKRDIDRELHRLVQRVEATHARSRLYLYFAGHGIAAGGGTGAVLMADAEPGLSENISVRSYRSWIERCRFFTELVLISDCCRSIASEVPEGTPPHTQCAEPFPHRQRILVALAADLGSPAYETADSRGQFTRMLLDGLAGRAADASTGVVDSRSLKGFLESAMGSRSDPPQWPWVDIAGEPILLATTAIERFEVVLHVGDGPRRTISVAGGNGDAVSEERSAGPWSLRLPRGLYEMNDAIGTNRLFKVDGSHEPVSVPE